ncbi:hypothetical protein KUTeg_014291 [Tegillarca granosa]|uniref:Protein-cysteine N-palmitoyltransferase Rasp n=1 Tax=Tegillarca granosa TaxID=220873 RepID=A0ABQ9F0K8_TEGGR|nr:hypothetical protein KUTeg_014291 [Tegillarca granosa]
MTKKKKMEDECLKKFTNSGYIRPIPSLELKIYLAVHIGSVAYICYCVFEASKEYDGLLNVYEFEPGWKILGREKDVSNFEWHFFYQFFWKIWPWFLGHISLSKIVEWNFLQYRRSIYLVYSISVLTFVLGWKIILLFIAHCIIIYCITSVWRSTTVIWITSITLLSTLNLEQHTGMMKSLGLFDDEGHFYYLLMFTLALAQLRYTSFCLELFSHQEGLDTAGASDKEITLSLYCSLFMDLLFYIFYFPLFFTGPILTYNQFKYQFSRPPIPWTKNRVISLIWHFIRVAFWALLNELCLHYFYFNAIQHNISILKKINLWALAGLGYCSGQFFMTKYTVMFGLPANIARIDHLDPPPRPKCIAYLYLYSDMWKYFDCGMYNFIKRYIYVPLGGSRLGTLRRFGGSFICFCFVYYWHGTDFYVFIWSILNFIGVSIEVLAWMFLDLPIITKLEVSCNLLWHKQL